MSDRSAGSRHRSREVALQTLFAIDLAARGRALARERAGGASNDSRSDGSQSRSEPLSEQGSEPSSEQRSEQPKEVGELETPDRVFERIAANFEAPPAAREFAWELISQVCAREEALDVLVASRARNWRISRMAAVDRNILRIGAYELAYTDTPAAVVMDEAVELARRFGTEASPSFVNGVLDALARSVADGSARATTEEAAEHARGRPG